MSDLFVEVDEALKQEKLEKVWQQYGGLLIAFLAALVLGTATNAGYKSWAKAQNEKQTSVFLSVIDQDDYTADELLAITPKLNDDFAGLAQIHAAGLLLKDRQTTKAVEIYKQVPESSELYGMAQYMIVTHSEDIKAEDKLAKLEEIGADESNPWHYHALLDYAVLQANHANNFKAAREKLFVIINADDAPQTLRQKAQSLHILYAAQQHTDKT